MNLLLQWFNRVLGLTQQVEGHSEAIKELRREVKRLSDAIDRLDNSQQTAQTEGNLWRENLLLRLRVQLLEYERRLPPPPPGTPPFPPPTLEDR